MNSKNFRLCVLLRGSKYLEEDIKQILTDYLRAGGMNKERILEVLEINLVSSESTMSNDLPLVKTEDLRYRSAKRS